ncbi:MAG: superoxide dismutase [Podila humilis]|nr:MAG: superoxide dismutase [Podila humilis]
MIFKTSTALCIAALCFMTGGQAQLVTPDSNTLVANIDMNGIKALFTFTPVTKGTGANVSIEVQEGLSKSFALSLTKGFEYHVHVSPVGPNNNCTATGGHLDPANVGTTKCISATPTKCQEGDLSGKHGELKATDGGAIPKVEYVDQQLRFDGETTTIVGRSIVIHNNGARVACGNIVPYGQVTSQSNNSGEPVTNLAENVPESKKLTSGASGSRHEHGSVNGGHAFVALGVVASWMVMM